MTPFKVTRGCRSCSGNGWVFDTSYVRSGEEVECTACYGTGLTQAAIRQALKTYRKVRGNKGRRAR